MRYVLVIFLTCSCGGGSGSPDAMNDPDATPADAAGPDATPRCDESLPNPVTLECTGLYADWDDRTLADGVLEYTPGFQLWSDGAAKRRWIQLPPGTQIDVDDPNEWVFPVGTKIWKEFSLSLGVGTEVRQVETRFLWKKSEDIWYRTTYVWNDDLTAADEVTDGVEDVGGTTYDIPRQSLCVRCHQGRLDNVLGFEAISLAAPEAQGLTWTVLQDQGLLASTNGNHLRAADTLQIPGVPTERTALGYLHENCGIACHNANNPASRFTMRLDVDALGAVADTSIYQTAINQTSEFRPNDALPETAYYRIRPLDLVRSTIHHRMGVRDVDATSPEQMPPLATNVVDDAGQGAVQAWIEYMTEDNGYPAPAPETLP